MDRKFKIIPYHIYPFNVLVSFHNRFEDLERVLKNILPEDEQSEIIKIKGDHSAYTKMFPGGQTVIWFHDVDRFSEGQVAHEAFHAVHFLFYHLQIPLTLKTSEVYAYCIHYLVDEIMRVKKKI